MTQKLLAKVMLTKSMTSLEDKQLHCLYKRMLEANCRMYTPCYASLYTPLLWWPVHPIVMVASTPHCYCDLYTLLLCWPVHPLVMLACTPPCYAGLCTPLLCWPVHPLVMLACAPPCYAGLCTPLLCWPVHPLKLFVLRAQSVMHTSVYIQCMYVACLHWFVVHR